ncbi:hypothetical protein VOLCADRAFT_107213 [Volvox carteri f. nagariensis]|uniref:Uncharacterized protein n=1 Tax=Volvox carteri f. nagariensis TaxID=3068 RepID=D8UCM7_VOLCA|nr:uncharacterized protein VOLCADRAFT_107213 [Volvox carteri f. nagariensis]EFJ42578.1 hypothetical protein VOLCADRAFT_107213 [Volvox carteri f. nagariensis]|eukprot:XP_002956434.1 hypothetical protein VOLCADRAFT_107213 [Volvox carteri f. nagariensis]
MATLIQRQWRQRAQTAVRRAVTTAKEARSRFQALSDGGDTAVSDLANITLQLSHLPALRLPDSVADLRPDVRAAAAAKLVRQLAVLVTGLMEGVRQLGSCVEMLAGALACLDEVPQEEPWARTTAVFHTMPLPSIRQLLAKVCNMYQLEYDSKAAVAAALAGLVAGPLTAAEAKAAEPDTDVRGGGCSRRDPCGAAVLAEVTRQGGVAAKRLPDLCTAYLSVWMLSPYLEDEQADEALGALTEDMVAF